MGGMETCDGSRISINEYNAWDMCERSGNVKTIKSKWEIIFKGSHIHRKLLLHGRARSKER